MESEPISSHTHFSRAPQVQMPFRIQRVDTFDFCFAALSRSPSFILSFPQHIWSMWDQSSGPLFRFVWPFNCISHSWSLTETSNTCLWFKDSLCWSLLSDVSDLSPRCKPTLLLATAVELPSLVTKGTIVSSAVLCITNLSKAIKKPVVTEMDGNVGRSP